MANLKPVDPSLMGSNFIKEIEPRIRKSSDGKTRKDRYVLLECLNCNGHFECTLHNAKRIHQKCCSRECSHRYNEVFVGGNEKHPLYSRWLSMRQRCNNSTSTNYVNYGERGITISQEFLEFVNYVNYVTSLEGYDVHSLHKLSLDRIDNNKGYQVGNLRWTNPSTQIANQRANSRGRNKFTGVNWNKTHSRWVARVNYEGKTLYSKVCLTEEEALTARNEFITANNLPHPIQQF